MEINIATKFNVGQKLYKIDNNNITTYTVKRIVIEYANAIGCEPELRIVYHLSHSVIIGESQAIQRYYPSLDSLTKHIEEQASQINTTGNYDETENQED